MPLKPRIVGIAIVLLGVAALAAVFSSRHDGDTTTSIATNTAAEDSKLAALDNAGTSSNHESEANSATQAGDVVSTQQHSATASAKTSIQALEVLAGAEPLTARLARLESLLGNEHRVTNSEKANAVQTCEQLHDEGIVTTAEEDGTKAWALANLKAQCEGLQDIKVQMFGTQPSKTSQIGDLLNAGDLEGVKRIASEALAEALIVSDIQLATLALLESGAFRLESLNPQFKFVPQEEVLRSIAFAGQLVMCARGGGCGPKSLATAVYCTNVGCSPGSNYENAIYSSVPQRQSELVRALVAWMQPRTALH